MEKETRPEIESVEREYLFQEQVIIPNGDKVWKTMGYGQAEHLKTWEKMHNDFMSEVEEKNRLKCRIVKKGEELE